MRDSPWWRELVQVRRDLTSEARKIGESQQVVEEDENDCLR